MSTTYSDVDGSDDPDEAIGWQERVDRWPQVQAYKLRVLELLEESGRVLDIGCGPGADVVARGADRSIGLDRSLAMCRTAQARNATVVRADAHRLPFADAQFGGVVADRVVQHLAAPERALAEMVRVVRRGGRLVIADPDQETLTIHVPGVRQQLVDRVKALRRDVGYRNGRLVASLPFRLAAFGVDEVSVEPFPLVLTDPDLAFGLPGWPRTWAAAHGFSPADVAEWDHGMEQSRDGGFLYALIYFVVSGVRA